MTDYRALLRDAGINFSALSFSEQNKLINALHAAYSQGYLSGYHAALNAPSFVHGL
jgi:hypothetical protein